MLEEADLQAPDLEGEFARVIAAGSPPDELDQPRLAVAVAASTLTPMGGSLGSLTLAGLPRADQLRELDFDLPPDVPTTALPDAVRLALLRGPVAEQIAEVYPAFAKAVFGSA